MTQASKRAARMLETALEMESRGRQFYSDAVASCGHPYGRALFQKLLEDEGTHQAKIQSIFKEVNAGAAFPDVPEADEERPPDLDRFFKSLVRGAKRSVVAQANDLQALDLGVAFEQQAVKFYEAELARASDPLEARFIRSMIAEERGHVRALEDLKDYLVDPDAWFAKHERFLADG